MREWIKNLSPLDRDCVQQYEFLLDRKLTGLEEYREIDNQVDEMILEYERKRDFFSEYPELCKYRAGQDFVKGDRVVISGDCAEFWVDDYNVRLDTEGTVWHTPSPYERKVMVMIDEIGHDKNVLGLLRRSKLKKVTVEVT